MNPGPTEKFLHNKRTIHIGGPQLHIIAWILELLKIFSELIGGSKCGPLEKTEKQATSYKLDLLKSFSKRETPV